MTQPLPLDVKVDGDTEVQTNSTQALRIKAIGTDSTSAITPSIQGNEVGAIVTEIGDTTVSANSEQGLLDLRDLYYYVPPDTTISFDGSSGDTVRLQGQRLDNVDSDFVNSTDQTRFNEQGQYHYTFEEGAVSVSEQIADEDTFTVHTVNPATDEQITMAGIMSISQSSSGSYSTSEDEIGVFFDFDGQRLPSQFADDSLFLIDFTNMPRPPTDTTDQIPFVWDNYDASPSPLTVMGDQRFDVKIRNISGGALGNGGDTSTFTFTGAVIFDERR